MVTEEQPSSIFLVPSSPEAEGAPAAGCNSAGGLHLRPLGSPKCWLVHNFVE